MGKRKIDIGTLRFLYVHSGNCCAFEGCHNPIFEDDGTLTGECCHIEAFSPKGPRYNTCQSDEERNGYDNLVLMCARHHKIIDGNPKKYSVELLKEMKRIHENQFYASQLKATDRMLYQLQIDSERYWKNLKRRDADDDTGYKMMIEEQNISSLMTNIEEIYETLWNLIESVTKSSEQLQIDIKKECEKCGIDYRLFDTIPYYENSLIHRDWEITSIGFPNNMSLLKLKFLQLCVIMLEKIVKHDPTQSNMDLLEICKQKLEESHMNAYYLD